MFLAYEIIVHLALLLAFPLLLMRPALRERLNERTGDWSPIFLERLRGGPVVWIHCASVGEVQAARPLVESLFASHPNCRFLVTTMTLTGRGLAEKLFGKRAAVSLLPLDSYRFVHRVVKRVKPSLLLLFETELWPQFIRAVHGQGGRVVLVNGRISARSFPRYKLIRPFLGRLFALIDQYWMEGGESAARIVALGAPADRVRVLGNIKWAGVPVASGISDVPGWPADALAWLAGSTHPGEDELVLAAHEDLLQYYPGMRLILAPRHPGRAADVAKLVRSHGFECTLRTSGQPSGPVYLVDTVGELTGFFPRARVVFLGGSLVPVGGHNALEPAAAGVPVLYGPHMENFTDVAAALESRGAGRQVADWKDLAFQLRTLLSEPPKLRKMGEAGRALVAENAVILKNYIEALKGVMP